MDALIGPYLAAVALLAVGGAPKAWSPADTTRALRLLRFPVTRPAVRLVGAAEVLTAVAAVALPGRATAAAIAAWYAVFAVVIVVALRARAPLSSCGCFGSAESPPSRSHLVLVLAASGVAAGFAAAPSPDLLAGQPAYGVPFAGMVALATWFGYLVMTRLATLSAATGGRA